MSNVVVVYHSGYGHTRVMAEAVGQGVERHLGSICRLIPVSYTHLTLPTIYSV